MTPGNPSKGCGNLKPSDLEAVMVKLCWKAWHCSIEATSSFPVLENTKGHVKNSLILLSSPFLRHVNQGTWGVVRPFLKV